MMIVPILKKSIIYTLFPFIASLIFFFVAYYSISSGLSVVSGISLTVSSDHANIIKLYYDNSPLHPTFTEKKTSIHNINNSEQTEVFFRIHAESLTGLRIDMQEGSRNIRIYKIILKQALKRKTTITAKEIYDHFSSRLNNNIDIALRNGYVEISATGKDPYVVSANGILPVSPPVFIYIPIFILTFYFFRITSSLPSEKITSFFLPHRKLPSNNATVIYPLDGLRGLALLLVVAEHTLPSFLGAGHSGVLIFFGLSGFLLTKPFVNQPHKLCDLESLIQYGGRRLKRILPMYYFYLFMVYGMSLRVNDLVLHAFFIEGRGHLWTLPQEMVFYIFFPVLTLIHSKVFKSNIYSMILFLLLVIFFWQRFIKIETLYLFGMADQKIPLLIPIFLFGSIFSYIYFGICEQCSHFPSDRIDCLFTTIGILIILMFITMSNGHLIGSQTIYSIEYGIEFGLCASLLVFIVNCSRKNILTKILSNRILASIGVVSYSIYLIHPLVINLVKLVNLTGFIFFTIVLFVSYIFSCVTYHFIENPRFMLPVKKRV